MSTEREETLRAVASYLREKYGQGSPAAADLGRMADLEAGGQGVIGEGRSPWQYAWCFDHGRLHQFDLVNGPWCSACWAWLDGSTEEEAMGSKRARFNGARFLAELSRDQQVILIRESTDRLTP